LYHTYSEHDAHKHSSLNEHHGSTGGTIAWIHGVFDNSDKKAIIWMIGDVYADFDMKRMFLLYGPGGIGKSSVVDIIATALGGTLTKL
jgi:phage/plasmid-associated DNA primase